MNKTIKNIILLIAIGLMVFSGFKLWDIYSEYAKGDKLYDEYASKFTIDAVEAAEIVNEDIGVKEAQFSINFDALLSENEDIVGWIYSEDTPINYPIVQSGDNDYYLRRLLDGSYNIAGTIFMDYRNSSDLSDLNTIIYGHNLKSGTMFGTLKEYNNQDYYDKHPRIDLYTPGADYVIEVIAGYQTDIYSNIYILPETTEELEVLYEEIVDLSIFKTDIQFEEGDRLITLSTCTDGVDISRYVLIGKLIEI